MRNALLTVIVLSPLLTGCPGDEGKTTTGSDGDPAVGETGAPEVPPAAAPAAGDTGSAPGPDATCDQLLTECRVELGICTGAK